MLTRVRSRLAAASVAGLTVIASVAALAGPSQASGASIGGIVVNQSDDGLADLDVTVYKRQGGDWVQWDTVFTKGTGKYRFGGLAPGAYRVCANEYHSAPGYFAQCWKTGDTVDQGRTIKLVDEQAVKGRRITLAPGGTISGVVDGTAPARNGETVQLAVVDMSGMVIEAIRATIGTEYTIGPLETGSYRVQFDRASTESRYSGQFFDGVSETAGVAAATAVSVTTGVDTPSVDATMTTGGSIAGFTKTTAGDPVQWCGVIALADDGVRSSRYAESSKTGRFVITGLSPGSYQVVALGCVNVEKWYDDSNPRNVTAVKGDADQVEVTDGATTGIGTLKVRTS